MCIFCSLLRDVALERAIQFIKGGFSFRLRSGREVWQRGHTEHRVQDAEDFERHVEYIAQNPVRAGLGVDYAWSHVAHPELVDPTRGILVVEPRAKDLLLN